MGTKKIVYIGNKLRAKGRTITTIETLSTQLRSLGFEVRTYSGVENKFFRFLDMLRGVIANVRSADLVLIDTYSTQNFYYAVAVGNLCRLFRIPYIPILHGGNLPVRLQNNKYLSHKLFHGAKTNVAPSHYLMEVFASEGYTNLTYIPNTIEISDYSFLLRKHTVPKLLWVRSFAEIYNPMLALLTLELLLKTHPRASLCMVGPEKDGSFTKCKEFAQQKGLPVTFTGKLSKETWRELSQDYDVFLNTTNFDNTPVSIIEAMALGLPVVSTNVGGLPFLIEDQINGVLVAPNDPVALANAINSLKQDKQRVMALSKEGRKKSEHFNWEKVQQDWVRLLKQ